MTRNSKNEYSKNEYSKNGYEKSEYSKNQKNSRDCNHVKDREMSSYGQQNREQDEKDEYEKYEVNLGIPAEKSRRRVPYGLCRRFLHTYKTGEKVRSGEGDQDMAGMTLLAADQLDWYVGKPWAMIIDVRNRREYEKGHVKGAVNLPYDHLLERVCLPRDKILVICCERGAASMAEGKRLAENGYEVKTVIGGMHAYRGRYLVAGEEL